MPQEDFSKYNGAGTELRVAQLRLLDILKEIDKICKKHNITYWLDFGSMLGCVRHKGFIPWDDDLDIAVYEKDYERLLKLLQEELPSQYRVEWPGNNKNFAFNFAKVVDSMSYVEQGEDAWSQRAGITGLWVDIFPKIHSNSQIRRIVEPIYGRCFRHSRNYENIRHKKVFAYLLYPLAIIVLLIAKIICLFTPKDQLISSYGAGKIPVHYATIYRYWIEPTIDMPFEGGLFPIPSNYDAYLTALYGDYMSIPPVEKRTVHIGSVKVY